MYMSLKPNKHKRISFNTTTMASLGFIDPPPQNLIFCSGPPNYFGLKFLGLTPKIRGAATMGYLFAYFVLSSPYYFSSH